jgi:acyl-coenzyme A synthetase/AMP-(fatty) acid ligase
MVKETKSNQINVNQSIYQAWAGENLSSEERKRVPAIDYYGNITTFEEADAEMDNFARSIASLNERKDSTTAFCTLAQKANLIGFCALNKIGRAASFISPPLLRLNAGECLDDTNTETLVTSYDFYKDMRDAIAKTSIKNIVFVSLTDYADDRKRLIGDLRDFNPKLKCIPAFLIEKNLEKGYQNIKKSDLIPGFNYMNYKEFMDAAKGDISTVEPAYTPGSTAVYLHTSGTTGKPKIIERGNEDITLCSNAYTSVENFEAHPGDRNGQFYPLFPTTMFTGNFVSPWYLGMTHVIDPLAAFNGKFAKSIYKNRINGTTATPNAYETFLTTNDLPENSMGFFRLPFSGGEPLTEKSVYDINQRFKFLGIKNPLVICYGLSEGNPGTHFEIGNWELGNRAGRPIPGTESRIVDDNGNIVGPNVRGKIEIKPAAYMLGYFNDPDATSKKWTADGWIKSNDVAIKDEDGYNNILGRDSESFVDANNDKHYIFDICEVLNQDKNILRAEASVVDGNIPTAFIRLRDGKGTDMPMEVLETTVKRCRRDLPPLAVPVGYRFAKSFALNPYTPKIDLEILKTIRDGFYNIDENGLYIVAIAPSGEIQKNYIKNRNVKKLKIYEPVERKI